MTTEPQEISPAGSVDAETYIAVLKDQRGQALDAAAILQTRLIIAERELLECRKAQPAEPVKVE
jgi:hypothetical protein